MEVIEEEKLADEIKVVYDEKAIREYFREDPYYIPSKNPLKQEFTLNREKYQDIFNDILEKCKYVNTITFLKDVEEVLALVKDTNAPNEIRLVLAEWLYRKVFIFYKPNNPVVEETCTSLFQPIKECDNIVIKGLYIHYHNVLALRIIAEHFFLNRHPDPYFILQMLNDVQLIQTTPQEKILSHFLMWIKRTKNYEQQSNLLDVLLRHFPKNEEVKAVHDKMKYGGKKSAFVNLYDDAQNAHDEDIVEETIFAAQKLLKWHKKNPYDLEPPPGVYFEPRELLDEAIKSIHEFGEIPLIHEVVTRAKIDNTLFPGGFTIMQVFIALCRYISISPSKKELIKRLEEEFKEMNGLCSSGYINRFINTLQGFDPEYSVKISFKKQLQAALTHHLNKFFQTAPEEVIAGSYDLEYRTDYLEYIVEKVNSLLAKMFEQYGQKEVEKEIVEVLDVVSGIEGVWTYDKGISIK